MVPISELRLLEQMMRELAEMNQKDANEYLKDPDKYILYRETRAHQTTSELWAARVRELIERYKDE